MAVTTPYAYPDGQVIDPDGHNENVYSKNPGKGIQSEANGGLNSFKTGFEVQKEHIWPEEAVRLRQDAALETLDIVSEAHADSGEVVFRPVAGCSTKVYVPYAATLALWEWSVFISEAKFFIHLYDAAEYDSKALSYSVAATTVTPTMVIRARLTDSSGVVTDIPHSRRRLPTSCGHTRGTPGVQVFEDRCCLHFGMHHLQETLSAGWHELSLTLHQEQVLDNSAGDNSSDLYSDVITRVIGHTNTEREHVFYQRASFGIRNARVLTLL